MGDVITDAANSGDDHSMIQPLELIVIGSELEPTQTWVDERSIHPGVRLN